MTLCPKGLDKKIYEKLHDYLYDNEEKYAVMDDHNFYFCNFCMEKNGVLYDKDTMEDEDEVFTHILSKHQKELRRESKI